MPQKPLAKTLAARASKVMPTVKEVRAASKARAEAARKLKEAQDARASVVAKEEIATAEVAASLEVTKAKGKAQLAERRTRAAIARAENTEALLQRERERVAELEEALAAAPAEGKFNGESAYRAAHGKPMPGRGQSSVTKTARANLYAAFEDMGGVEALVRWGQSAPTEFYRIWARLIPVEVEDESKNMPLEDLLAMLAKRADQTVEQAAREIGTEILEKAKEEVDIEAAAALFGESQK